VFCVIGGDLLSQSGADRDGPPAHGRGSLQFTIAGRVQTSHRRCI